MKTPILTVLFSTILTFVMIGQQNQQALIKKEFRKVFDNKVRTNFEDFRSFHLNQEKGSEIVRSTPNATLDSRGGDDNIIIHEAEEAESELHAAINPLDTNNIIVCVMKNDPDNFFNPLTFPVYYSNDFGDTWNTGNFLGVPPIFEGSLLGGGDPILQFDSEGTVYLSWLTLTVNSTFTEGNLTLRMASSTDNGENWGWFSQPVDNGVISDLITLNNSTLVDKEWFVIDDSETFGKDNIYMAYAKIENYNSELSYNIVFKRKLADATSFEDTTLILSTDTYSLAQFASIDVDEQGIIHITFFASTDGDNYNMYYVRSEDQGLSFTPEVILSPIHLPVLSTDEPSGNIAGIADERLYPCPHLRADISGGVNSGNLYIVWTANGGMEKESEGLDIYFSKSIDNGLNWSDPSILNSDTGSVAHQFYPSLEVNNVGQVIVTWYDRRDDPDNINTHYYMTYSNDGGETFETDKCITTAATNFNTVGTVNSNFGIGEYNQVLSTEHYAIPIWSDGRNNNGALDVYAAFIEIGDIGSVSVPELKPIDSPLKLETIAPNPANKTVNINLTADFSSTIQFSILDIKGRVVQQYDSRKIPVGRSNIDLVLSPELKSGKYFLHLVSEHSYQTRKLTIVR